jgi:hypothetical protein
VASVFIPALLRGYARKQIEISWVIWLPTEGGKKSLSFKIATGASQLGSSSKAHLLEKLFQ